MSGPVNASVALETAAVQDPGGRVIVMIVTPMTRLANFV